MQGRKQLLFIEQMHRSGHLTAVYIPDVEDEVVRDVCRGRTDAVNDLKAAKKQLLSFLLRNGYHYPWEGRSAHCA
ncbi:hypothetical protein P4B35_12320 [Pontiellaceae bacterium B12227]|nr:hypothetical protein [Pontiellaceae bacterium B12227]